MSEAEVQFWGNLLRVLILSATVYEKYIMGRAHIGKIFPNSNTRRRGKIDVILVLHHSAAGL